MMGIVSTLVSGATGPWGYVAVALAAASGTFYVQHEIHKAADEAKVIASMQAVQDAWKFGWYKRDQQDQITGKANKENGDEQAGINNNTAGVIAAAPRYITVHDNAGCKLPPGFDVLLDAALTGRTADEVSADAGKSGGSTTPIALLEAATVLAQTAGDYHALRARVLNARGDWEHQEEVFDAKPPEKPGFWKRNFDWL